MKKFLFCFMFCLLLTIRIHAETDAKTVQFLEQLNRYYYCLKREGLKTCNFDISLTLSKSFRNQIKPQHREKKWFAALDHLKYSVSFPADGTKHITLMLPAYTGNSKMDADVKTAGEKLRDMVKDTLDVWSEFMVKTLHDQENYSGDCKVQNTANGFRVSISDKKGSGVEIYDRQAKLLSSSGTLKGIEFSSQSIYTSTPKGFLLKQEKTSFGEMTESSTFEYVEVEGFLMPKKILVVVQVPGLLNKGTAITLNCYNYVINQ